VDQLERNKCLSAARITAVRSALSGAERANPASRQTTLNQLSSEIAGEAAASCDASRMRLLSNAIRDLSTVS
jgi:hypothetical protein